MNHKQFATFAGAIFTVVGCIHLLRVVNGWQFLIGTWPVPMWVSIVAVLLTGYLAWSAWKLR